MKSKLDGKKIVLGITGSIAAYKSVELLRELQKRGADVTVAVTPSGLQFVSELTLKTLSGHPIYKDTVSEKTPEIRHTTIGMKTDLFIVAPATANTIAKIANGFADNPVTATALVVGKGIVCPAMNVKMFENPATQNNIKKLKELGYIIVESEEGYLACGVQGKGRLAEIDKIVEEAETFFTPKLLKNKKVVVTAGATREYIDPVRFISNPSSGKMGYAIAKIAKRMGAEVTLITGKTCLKKPYGIKTVTVETVNEMREAVLKEAQNSDIFISAAAVGDFTPVEKGKEKIKKADENLILELKRTPDILSEVSRKKLSKFIVGFAAETENLIENAKKKLTNKNLDMVVANNIKEGIFGEDKTHCFIISKNTILELEGTKEEVAEKLLTIISREL